MAAIVHYEVYVHDSIRGWVLQARHEGDARTEAVEEAKALEESLGRAVRVVREIYYPQNNVTEETVAYSGRVKPKTEARPTVRAAIGPVRAGYSNSGRSSTPQERQPRPIDRPAAQNQGAVSKVLMRLLAVIAASLVIAFIGTVIGSVLLNNIAVDAGLSTSNQSVLLFFIFICFFLLTVIPLVLSYVPLETVLGSSAPSKPPTAPKTPVKDKLFSTQSPNEDDAQKAKEAEAKKEKKAQKPFDALAEQADEEFQKADAARKAQEKEEAEARAAQAAKERAEAEEAEKQQKAKAEEPMIAFEQARLVLMKFLGGAVGAIKTAHPQLDAYNRFGVNLYLGGACDAVAENKRVSLEQHQKLLREAVEVVGTKPERAKQLADRLDSYKREPRYKQMIGAGRAAMEVFLAGTSDPFIAIGGVMKDWNTPQSQQASSGDVTIMFTDMIGSTDMTHDVGDRAAQDVIRAHNTIVRAALTQHNGKEVKHTGDGIMASFDDPTDSVLAAIQIQKKALIHNERWPNLPLKLRLGMNTGEPIIEENDYFGATVQVAARVCAAAGLAQVWVSQETRNLVPAASGIEFHSQGDHNLKGVKGDRTLFEVIWNDNRRQEVAAEKATQAALVEQAAPEGETGEKPAAAGGGRATTKKSNRGTAKSGGKPSAESSSEQPAE